ncbi:Acetyltransferase (GNAT) family [Chlamydia abortus]|nr:Acetyltransferase (GNAT) family [Chlamydia abortus]
MNGNIRIVEYEPHYARAIAEMWNASTEGWGGGTANRTEESILQEHANSTLLAAFLALDEDKVVGYCSFAHYRNDEGALYIPLLNVRPDYHGRKIGRDLVLSAVRRTIEMGWPRLDLFTWAGNTKAVPMYKKCGFFWEKRENATHLMNFIPTVLQTEALQPYFETMDWYEDGKRDIAIEPDGRNENGFDFFEYKWAKDGKSLRVEFEKTGRGIRLIETDDYILYAEADRHKLVFGKSYPIRYVIRNKSGAPLHVQIEGENNKNISFSLSRNLVVQEEAIIEGQFEVGPVEEDQNDWKTHPCVTARCRINGRSAELRVGIEPQYPAKLIFSAVNHESLLQGMEEGFITIENQDTRPLVFEFQLPSNECIRFEPERLSVSVPGEEIKTVAVSYRLQDFGLLSERVMIHAYSENSREEPVVFTRKIERIFKGQTGRFGGETQKQWFIVNGPYTLYYNKEDNEMWVHRYGEESRCRWMSPKLGRPYSPEFVKKQASRVSISREDQAMVLTAECDSEEFPSIRLTITAKLFPNGLVERFHEVHNLGTLTAEQPLHIGEGFYFSLNQGIIPYEGQVIDLRDPEVVSYDRLNDWDIHQISENWLFSYGSGDQVTWGMTWHPELALTKSEWHLQLEHPAGRPGPGEKVRTASTFLACGSFTNWSDFRSYALGRRDRVNPHLMSPFEVSVNNGNPFVQAGMEFTVQARERRNSPIEGRVSVSSRNGSFAAVERKMAEEEQMRLLDFRVEPLKEGGISDTVRLNLQSRMGERTIERAVFAFSDGVQPIEEMKLTDGTFRFSNGGVTFQASPAFGNALYSLQYNGREWLESSYPEPGPKSWWNPWLGGLGIELQGISQLSLQEETITAAFETLTDNYGNSWRGICLRTRVEKLKEKRGLELDQYYLMLPGTPVLCVVNRIRNRTGRMFYDYRCMVDSFIGTDTEPEVQWFRGQPDRTYKRGSKAPEIQSQGLLELGSERHEDRMLYISGEKNTYAFSNNQILRVCSEEWVRLADRETVYTKPVFCLFTDRDWTSEAFTELRRIRFGAEENK